MSNQSQKRKWWNKQKDEDRKIPLRQCANKPRKRRLERDPAAWLRWYFPDVYPLPFSKPHRDMITAAHRAMKDGTGVCVAAPRGMGKSTILGGMALYGALTGLASFPVVVGWQHSAAKRMYRGWLNDLAENDNLADDYPEVCDPFRESIQAKRVRGLIWDSGESCGADVRQTEGFLVLPGGRALAAASIRGSIRGMRVEVGGKWLRPDVILLDDPQDKPTAKSPTLVRQVMERIDHDLVSLAGPSKRMAVMSAVTVIEPDDVAEQLLSRRDMEAIRCGQIVTWPVDFARRDGSVRKLWDGWNEARLNGVQDGDGGKAARVYYRENKPAMTNGMTVSWPQRFDKGRGEPDAMYSAMWDYYRLGEAAFMAERQNTPIKSEASVYDLKWDVVSRAVMTGRQRGDVPYDAGVLVVATDLNHYGLHSASIGFSNDQTGAVIWYGRHDNEGRGVVPKDVPEPEAKRLMYEALVIHGRELAALPLTRGGQRASPGLWMIDGGYMADVVRRFIETAGRTIGMPCCMARGFSGDKYRPFGKFVIGKPREQTHQTTSEVAGRFVAFNADYWREVSQRGWLATPGAPGSLSLYDGRHIEFAEQVCREKLLEKLQGQYGPVWRWGTAPGWHDYGDAVTMCYVAACWQGVGTQAGNVPQQRRYVEKRKCKVERQG